MRIQLNLRRFAHCKSEVRIRIPIIPGVNDFPEEACHMAGFLRAAEFGGLVELLPFHLMGKGKYEAMRLPYSFSDTALPTIERMSALKELFSAAGLSAETAR